METIFRTLQWFCGLILDKILKTEIDVSCLFGLKPFGIDLWSRSVFFMVGRYSCLFKKDKFVSRLGQLCIRRPSEVSRSSVPNPLRHHEQQRAPYWQQSERSPKWGAGDLRCVCLLLIDFFTYLQWTPGGLLLHRSRWGVWGRQDLIREWGWMAVRCREMVKLTTLGDRTSDSGAACY